jgi:hypothetical protein
VTGDHRLVNAGVDLTTRCPGEHLDDHTVPPGEYGILIGDPHTGPSILVEGTPAQLVDFAERVRARALRAVIHLRDHPTPPPDQSEPFHA